LTPIFYFVVDSTPLTALSISTIIMGLVSVALGNARPNVSPEASQMMLRTGVENIAILLEELGLRSRAVYLPSSVSGGRPRALIPLSEDGAALKWDRVPSDRLIVRYGPNPEDMGLSVITPGGISLDSLELRPAPAQIEGTLSSIIVGIMDLADSVSAHLSSDRVLVEIAKPKLRYQNLWFHRCLGSPLASIAATVVCEALDRPVRIGSEEETGKGIRVEIEVLP
jgi:hypothetical protein